MRSRFVLVLFLVVAVASASCDDNGTETEESTDGSAGEDAGGHSSYPADDAGLDSGADSGVAGSDKYGNLSDGEPGTFREKYLNRRYFLYVPESYDPAQPIAVVLGFHGAVDTAANFFRVSEETGWFDAAERGPFALIVPETKSPFMRSWVTWSLNSARDGPKILDEMAEVLELVDQLSAHFNLDETRFYAYGFSDGGLFIGSGALGHSTRFAGLVICGASWGPRYPYFTPDNLTPLYYLCGEVDAVLCTQAEQTKDFLAEMGHPLEWASVLGAGHVFESLMKYRSPQTIYEWLSQYALESE